MSNDPKDKELKAEEEEYEEVEEFDPFEEAQEEVPEVGQGEEVEAPRRLTVHPGRIAAIVLILTSAASVGLLFLFPGAGPLFSTAAELFGISFGLSVGYLLAYLAIAVGVATAVGLVAHIAITKKIDEGYVPPEASPKPSAKVTTAELRESDDPAINNKLMMLEEHKVAYRNQPIRQLAGQPAPPPLVSAREAGASYTPPTASAAPAAVVSPAPAPVVSEPTAESVGLAASSRDLSVAEKELTEAIREAGKKDEKVAEAPQRPQPLRAPPPKLSVISQMTKEEQEARLAEIAARQAVGAAADAAPPAPPVVDAGPKV